MAKKESTGRDYLRQEEGRTIINLARAETINGEKVDNVTMREPTVGDWKRMNNHSGSDADKEIFGIANLVGITPKDVEGFSLRNMARLQEAFALFTA